MNYATPENLMGMNFLAIMIILGAFFILIPINRTARSWSYFLPLIAGALYIPYEQYFHNPSISITVPIRVDLMLILPAFLIAFPTATFMWGMIALRRKEEKSSAGIIAPFMATVMLACTIVWPVYIKYYLMGN